MQQPEVVALNHFCQLHEVELTFIEELETLGIIEILQHENERFLKLEEISVVERCIRLHFDLNINAEGLITVGHLIDTLEELNDELRRVKNRLSVYEDV
jgi:hypothetical protein